MGMCVQILKRRHSNRNKHRRRTVPGTSRDRDYIGLHSENLLHREQPNPRDRQLQEHQSQRLINPDQRPAHNLHAQLKHLESPKSIPINDREHEPVHRIDAKSEQSPQVLNVDHWMVLFFSTI